MPRWESGRSWQGSQYGIFGCPAFGCFLSGCFYFAARVCSPELQTHFSHTFLRELPHGKLVFFNDFHGTASNWMEILCNPRPRNDKAFIFLPRDLYLLPSTAVLVWGCAFCVSTASNPSLLWLAGAGGEQFIGGRTRTHPPKNLTLICEGG